MKRRAKAKPKRAKRRSPADDVAIVCVTKRTLDTLANELERLSETLWVAAVAVRKASEKGRES